MTPTGLLYRARPDTRICIICGDKIPGAIKWKRTCSSGCRTAQAAKVRATNARCGRRRAHGHDGRRVVECAECGVVFSPLTKGARRFCTTACRMRDFHRIHDPKRRAVVNAEGAENVDPREVFHRDRFRCQKCGKRVSATVKMYGKTRATIDHIVPISRGGEHTYANIQTACWPCNSAKGATMNGDQTRLC